MVASPPVNSNTDKDIVKLHQILSLKHLGFSLDDIRDRLIPLDTPAGVAQVLSEQAAVVDTPAS